MNLIESRIDLAIRTGNDPDPALIAPPLAVCESVLVAAPAYLKEHGKPGHRCLGRANVGRSTWVFQRGEVTETVNVWTAFTANEATALLQAAVHGGGIALQPAYLAN